MEINTIITLLQQHYGLFIRSIELFRQGGNTTYCVNTGSSTYFAKVIGGVFLDTAKTSLEIQTYLIEHSFPVIPIVPTLTGESSIEFRIQGAGYILVLYPFIRGHEPSVDQLVDAGALVGELHCIMAQYPGQSVVRDKPFFIDRYTTMMKRLDYARLDEFQVLGDELWSRVKELPRGFCHGDLYDGNVHHAENGKVYIVDFDTACTAFPMYDIVLFCNRTDYFQFDTLGYARTRTRLGQFLEGYSQVRSLSRAEVEVLDVMIALYHYQLQATIFEIHGYDETTIPFLDRQYEWLCRWKDQCIQMNTW